MRVRTAGDTLLLVEWDAAIDPEVNRRVIAVAERLRRRVRRGVRDIVPAYRSIGIHYDPLLTDLPALERVIAEEASHEVDAAADGETRLVEIPVRYGGRHGPDLQSVAEWAGCSTAEVVERHAGRVYRVYMLGFVPGFAYLGRVDPSIAAPRRRVPRDRVPRGAVGIGGEQTAVYPAATPGGWQLIGQTSLVMFEPGREQPSLLRPGDCVRFIPVDEG